MEPSSLEVGDAVLTSEVVVQLRGVAVEGRGMVPWSCDMTVRFPGQVLRRCVCLI